MLLIKVYKSPTFVVLLQRFTDKFVRVRTHARTHTQSLQHVMQESEDVSQRRYTHAATLRCGAVR